MRLKDKIAMVTGAGAGIGKATSLLFAREGATVVVADINEKTAAETSGEVEALGRRALTVQADVSRYEEAKKMMEAVLAQLGRVDILVNNAGIGDVRKFTEITEADWDRILSVNLKSVFNCTQPIVRAMIDRRSGRIINLASVAGLTGTPSHVHYSAAKGGVVAFTKALAKEVGQYGVTVNAIAPGMVETGFGGGAP
ncbi:MAG: SDR family NAD(P)-dependent oxidoreductase, partial [Pseudomonadota bacterium]